jgi:hypothetical protein
MNKKTDPFAIENLRLPDDMIAERPATVPRKIRKRREHFVILPMIWWEKLEGASGRTCRVAWYLLYQHWKDAGKPIKLANAILAAAGISPDSKTRALRDLEKRGLISVEWRDRKAPRVTVLA